MFRNTLIAVASATLLSTALADTVRMNGATTVLNVVVKPTQAAVEKASGHTLQIVGNATGKGLVDLANGDADVAMVSEPLEIALEAAQAAGKTLDAKTLQFAVVKKDEVVFTINAANPVHKLTFDQLRDIHTGKITNWKEVGGKDLAIVVYSDAATGGTRAMVKHIAMRGAEYGSNVKAQTSVKRAAELVSTDEAGIAGVGKSFVVEGKAKIVETTKIERPLGFVTIGAPKPAVKSVIEAFAKEAAGL
jgi:phosphate transport system substrate-binding protein